MEEKLKDKYAKLDALDSKSSAILQLASVYLVLLFLLSQRDGETRSIGLVASFVMMTVALLLNLWILWFHESPSDKFVFYRIRIFNVSVFLVFVGIMVSLVAIVGNLIMQQINFHVQ